MLSTHKEKPKGTSFVDEQMLGRVLKKTNKKEKNLLTWEQC